MSFIYQTKSHTQGKHHLPSPTLAGDGLCFKVKVKKISKLFLISGFIFSLFTSNTNAQGIPTFDATNLGQAVLQVQEMQKAYQKQIEQIDAQLATMNSLKGARDIGDLINSHEDKDLRRALPNTFSELLNVKSIGTLGQAWIKTQEIYNNIMETYDPLEGGELYPSDPNGTLSSSYDRHMKTTTTAMAASQSAYDNAAKRLEGYETLLEELNTSPDVKSSVDLLARISTENGILMNEIMRLQALQIQLESTGKGQGLSMTKQIHNAHIYNEENAASNAFQNTEE